MKKFLGMFAAAGVALTLSTGASSALAVGTSLGTFDLTAMNNATVDYFDMRLNGGAGGIRTNFNVANVGDDFTMTRGSFFDVGGDPTPLDSNSATNQSFGGNAGGGWSGGSTPSDSFFRSIRYAAAFASAITGINNVVGGFNLANLIAQDQTGLFPPVFPSANFVGAAYAFAYNSSIQPGIDPMDPPTGNVAANVVLFDGVDTTVTQVVVDFNSPEFNAGSIVVNNQLYELYYATQSGPNNPQVPEIDGPVLAQVGFVLAALYFVLLGRRRRDDDVMGMSQAA